MKLPRLTGLSLRAALVYLVLGFTLGGLLLYHKGIPIHPVMWSLLPAHMDFLLIGWTSQLIMAVAFWIAPRFGGDRPKRGNQSLAWVSLIVLNLGVWAVALSPFIQFSNELRLFGRSAEAISGIMFAIYLWPRIKSWGK